MDITLINPPLDKQTTSKFPMSGIPIGIACLAAYLRENKIEVSVIDAPIEYYDTKQTAEKVIKLNPLIAGISCLTENRYAALNTLKEIKQLNPNIKLIIGGVHPTPLDESILKNYPFVDAVIRGEGEIPLLQYVKAIKNNTDLNQVKGISFIKDNQVIKTPNPPFITNLDSLPIPAYDLFPIKKYPPLPDLKYKNVLSTTITTSRGCPMNCPFCITTKHWGTLIRCMSAERIFREVKYLHDNLGITLFRFVDDLFTIKKERVIDFCKLVVNNNLNIIFRLQARVDTMDAETLSWLKKAGCDQIEYGAESGSQKVLDLMRKRIKVQQIIDITKKTREAQIKSKLFLILGYIGEREQETYETFQLIKNAKPDWIGINPLTIYPGTEVYKIAKDKGLINDETWLTYKNQKTGNAPIYSEYYSIKEAIFLSQLGKVWSMKNSPESKEHRLIERVIGKPLNEKLIKTIIFNKTLRKSLSTASAALSPLLP